MFNIVYKDLKKLNKIKINYVYSREWKKKNPLK